VLSGDGGDVSSHQPTPQKHATPQAEPPPPEGPETATSPPIAETASADVGEAPGVEEAPTPDEGGAGPCPTAAFVLALGLGVALVANRRVTP